MSVFPKMFSETCQQVNNRVTYYFVYSYFLLSNNSNNRGNCCIQCQTKVRKSGNSEAINSATSSNTGDSFSH